MLTLENFRATSTSSFVYLPTELSKRKNENYKVQLAPRCLDSRYKLLFEKLIVNSNVVLVSVQLFLLTQSSVVDNTSFSGKSVFSKFRAEDCNLPTEE